MMVVALALPLSWDCFARFGCIVERLRWPIECVFEWWRTTGTDVGQECSRCSGCGTHHTHGRGDGCCERKARWRCNRNRRCSRHRHTVDNGAVVQTEKRNGGTGHIQDVGRRTPRAGERNWTFFKSECRGENGSQKVQCEDLFQTRRN
jgi:hypothetical protein